MAEVQARVVVRGLVQGVYFRGSLQREATTRGVRGWVRNSADGSVEMVLQGDEAAVDRVLEWARVGPRGASVESVDVSWSPSERKLAGFRIIG